ncbi:tripartite tricarboxylate transporter substrate binding protein [Halalkalibacterium ligniniphilum]|uniref:tripartite tricarboxylate transporter substrate binding protein n=1 Tax=Halalkalibacterium ligniniphilum TaxID=1134413 RepID=UPI00034A07C1|nr:tripartite tricarboxylate transporter substrate binding protein [Halalkalibacterium ligniniphilum]
MKNQLMWGRKITFLGVICLVLSLLVACGSNKGATGSANDSNESADNFPEQEITIIVPYSAGGGFDLAARMLAPYLEKYLPNDTSVIIENVAGGNGNIGLGELTRANPDGHTLGLINLPGHFTQQILGDASYDLTEFEYVGNITRTDYIAAASPSSNYTELSQLQNADEVRAGITNISSTDGLGLVVAANHLDVNLRTINHPGSTEAILAAIRGDVDIVQLPVESLKNYIDTGDLVPLWSYTSERLEEYPDLPSIAELGYEELIDLVSLYRVIAATPNTPEERLSILRDAFEKAVNDEEYIEQVLAAGATWNPSNYEDATNIAEASLEMLLPYEELMRSE